MGDVIVWLVLIVGRSFVGFVLRIMEELGGRVTRHTRRVVSIIRGSYRVSRGVVYNGESELLLGCCPKDLLTFCRIVSYLCVVPISLCHSCRL